MDALEYEIRTVQEHRSRPRAGPALVAGGIYLVLMPIATFLVGEDIFARGWAAATAGEDMPGLVVIGSAVLSVLHVLPFLGGVLAGFWVTKRGITPKGMVLSLAGIPLIAALHAASFLCATAAWLAILLGITALLVSAVAGYVCVRLGESGE